MTGSYFRFSDGIQGLFNKRSSLIVDLYSLKVLRRHVNRLLNIKVSRSGDVLGSASVFDFSSLSNGLSLVSLFRGVYPLYFNVFFGVMRFDEGSVDDNISRDSNLSNGGVVGGFDRFVSSRKSSSNIWGVDPFNFFSVVVDVRFNESSVVGHISSNVNGSVFDSGSSLNRSGDDVSFFNSVLSSYENWIKLFSNLIDVRLNDDLLSGRFNEGVGDISGWSYNSLGDYFRFLYYSVHDHLWLRVYSFHGYVVGS